MKGETGGRISEKEKGLRACKILQVRYTKEVFNLQLLTYTAQDVCGVQT